VHTLLEKHDGLPIKDVGLSYEGLAQEQHVDKDPHNHSDQVHHSRLLTKKQISDMAFGIRDLSKKLAQLRLQLTVKNVFVLGKAHDSTLIGYSRELCEWLFETYRDINVYVEDTMKENEIFGAEELVAKNESYKKRLRWWDATLCQERPQMFDIVLAVGLPLSSLPLSFI
jgi:NAD+ kinase